MLATLTLSLLLSQGKASPTVSASIVSVIGVGDGVRTVVGTGFSIRPSRRVWPGQLIVTSDRVVEDAERGVCIESGGMRLCSVMYRDRLNDLAVLYVDKPAGKGLDFASGLPAVGSRVYSPGRLAGSSEGKAFSGLYRGTRLIDGRRWLQHSAKLGPGMAGSPLLDKAGDVIGVSGGRLNDGRDLYLASTSDSVSNAVEMAMRNIDIGARIMAQSSKNIGALGQALAPLDVHASPNVRSRVIWKGKIQDHLVVKDRTKSGWLRILMGDETFAYVRKENVLILPYLIDLKKRGRGFSP